MTTSTERVYNNDKMGLEDAHNDEQRSNLLFVQDDDSAEAQSASIRSPEEYNISLTRKMIYLALYFLLNLGITLSNKAVMDTAPYPWTLTTMHTATTSLGCILLLRMGVFQLTHLDQRDHLILSAFSVLFTLTIAIGNVALCAVLESKNISKKSADRSSALVSVPLNQVIRSTCPLMTIIIYRVFYNRSYSLETYLTMVPLFIGVALTTYGDYSATGYGLLVNILCVTLASVKGIAGNRLMTGTLKLSAFEVLFRMSPLAAIQCLCYAYFTGEIDQISLRSASGSPFSTSFMGALAANALTAFLLNVVSFEANKVCGALTMSVCGNVKQSLTILFGVILFSVPVTLLSGTGMFITIVGAAWYSKVELDAAQSKALF